MRRHQSFVPPKGWGTNSSASKSNTLRSHRGVVAPGSAMASPGEMNHPSLVWNFLQIEYQIIKYRYIVKQKENRHIQIELHRIGVSSCFFSWTNLKWITPSFHHFLRFNFSDPTWDLWLHRRLRLCLGFMPKKKRTVKDHWKSSTFWEGFLLCRSNNNSKKWSECTTMV